MPTTKKTTHTAAKKTTKKASKTATKKTATKKTAAKKTAAKKTAKPSSKSAAKPSSKSAKSRSSNKPKAPKKTAKKTAAKKSPKTVAKKTPKKSAKKTTRPAKPRPPAAPPPLAEDLRTRLHAILLEADPTLKIATVDEARAGGDEQRKRYTGNTWEMGTLWTDVLWAACRARSLRLEQLAETRPRRTSDFAGVEVASVFFVDVDRPGTLYYAPNPAMPAALFVEIPADVASVRTVLAEYAGGRERSVRLRAWMGFGSNLQIPHVYSGKLVAVDDHELDRFFVFSPVATTLTRRTYFSGSRFAYEIHGDDLFIWDLAWPPCTTSAKVLTDFKKIAPYDFPLDMPVDLVSAVHGFEFETADELARRIPAEPDSTPGVLTVLAAIGFRDLATVARLRRLLPGDVHIQAALANAAFRYGWEQLINHLARVVTDPEMKPQIADALADLEFSTLPDVPGRRLVLPLEASPDALLALAAAHGWTSHPTPEDQPGLRAELHLPGHTDAAPRRIRWHDILPLELSTLALEDADEARPLLESTFPTSPTDDPWRAATEQAWLGDHAPLLAALQTFLAADDWPDRLAAARLIGTTRLGAARDLVRAALAAEKHAPTKKSLKAALKLLEAS